MKSPRAAWLVRSLIVVLAIAAPGCTNPTPRKAPSGLSIVTMKLGNQEFELEVANTEATRETGLMNRPSMAPTQGMIFVFETAQPLSFWMKNTMIPLDIVYISESGRVVGVRQMKPYDQTAVPSSVPARWAVELNLGAAAKAGVQVGDVVSIPEAARDIPRVPVTRGAGIGEQKN